VVRSSGNVVTQKDGLDIQKAVSVTPKTERTGYTAAAVITQSTQFIKKKRRDPHTAVRWELRTGGAECDTGATSPSARRSD